MPTSTQIARWGNSLGLRIPKGLASELSIGEGDIVDISVKDGSIVITPSSRSFTLDELVDKITPRNRHGEIAWGPRTGNEQW